MSIYYENHFLLVCVLVPTSLFSQQTDYSIKLKSGETISEYVSLESAPRGRLVLKTRTNSYNLTQVAEFTIGGRKYSSITLESIDVPIGALVLSNSEKIQETLICRTVNGEIDLYSLVDKNGEVLSRHSFMDINETGIQAFRK